MTGNSGIGPKDSGVLDYQAVTEQFDLESDRGRSIVIRYYPPQQDILGTILFTSAMAVPQRYYRYFAHYLAKQGYATYTFDYSGIGESKLASLRGSEIVFEDWIAEIEAVSTWVGERGNQHLPRYYLSHSLGGQLFGTLPSPNNYDAMISITSQNGYWRFYKNSNRYFFLWYLIYPMLTFLWGYFPSSLVGLGEDLPPNIAMRWKKWCTSQNYFFDDDQYLPLLHYDQYKGPLLTIGFDDDPWATEEAIRDLYQHYENADQTHWHLAPTDYDLTSIGHLGYFRPKSEQIWKETVKWLQDQ